MAKPAKAKLTEAVSSSKRSRAGGKHGRTFCKRCFKKIAYGMSYCNNKCRQGIKAD